MYRNIFINVYTVNARSVNVERTGHFTSTSQGIQVIYFNEKMLISNLVHIACFWNNLYQVLKVLKRNARQIMMTLVWMNATINAGVIDILTKE
jgi:hypothetical protein